MSNRNQMLQTLEEIKEKIFKIHTYVEDLDITDEEWIAYDSLVMSLHTLIDKLENQIYYSS